MAIYNICMSTKTKCNKILYYNKYTIFIKTYIADIVYIAFIKFNLSIYKNSEIFLPKPILLYIENVVAFFCGLFKEINVSHRNDIHH